MVLSFFWVWILTDSFMMAQMWCFFVVTKAVALPLAHGCVVKIAWFLPYHIEIIKQIHADCMSLQVTPWYGIREWSECMPVTWTPPYSNQRVGGAVCIAYTKPTPSANLLLLSSVFYLSEMTSQDAEELGDLLNQPSFQGQTDNVRKFLSKLEPSVLPRLINNHVQRYTSRTAVHLAAANGLVDCLEILLKSGGWY